MPPVTTVAAFRFSAYFSKAFRHRPREELWPTDYSVPSYDHLNAEQSTEERRTFQGSFRAARVELRGSASCSCAARTMDGVQFALRARAPRRAVLRPEL